MQPSNDVIREYFDSHPNAMPSQAAAELGTSELVVVSALPEDQVCLFPLADKDELLSCLPHWGPMTTIVSVSGSIFEFKGDFPQGKYAYGYYNLITQGNGLHGHLSLDGLTAIALVSRPFRGKESHSINFFGSEGEMIFKVYLGRDSNRVLLPEQVTRFNALKERAIAA
ncbi:heme utilization cystosolic carrier protein HutX [Shewanella nanhaiensis]|uniref:Heme utilization cystosolic carrier protein HutX n=1 Tax=Shewanella nanhaiensis TaxID=2864872 RepID=A0ABS7DYH1_9GAMM|nr:heme utilization cystosolic carrier protein HutX [Shewanella nanhaiensis]MBW8182480.1 heme utilization cystosolic carrier protein HutX [Shewanella nanhaiensis]